MVLMQSLCADNLATVPNLTDSKYLCCGIDNGGIRRVQVAMARSFLAGSMQRRMYVSVGIIGSSSHLKV